MRRFRTSLWAIILVMLCGEASAHLDPEARTRTLILDRSENALVLYARIPAPLVFARTIAARQAGETPANTPFLTAKQTEHGPLTMLNRAAVTSDEHAFAEFVASGYRLTAGGVTLVAEDATTSVWAAGTPGPFLTPAQAEEALRTQSTDAAGPVLIGSAHIDLAVRYRPVAAGETLTIQSALPEIVLPANLYVDNHIIDAGPSGTTKREIAGQLLEPVTLGPPAAGPRWQLDLSQLVAEGQVAAGLLLLVALALGALHALEPGHAKTMMAAFIIAVKGTPVQALALGLSAALSHSILVVVLGVAGLTLAPDLGAATVAPAVSIVSGIVILILAGFTLRPLLHSRRLAAVSGTGREVHHHHHANLDADAHARAHAKDIAHRFRDSRATMRQVVAFGFAGGLVPCGAALTVLLLCLQLDRLWLGLSLLAAFSAGLAMTLTAVGLAASLGLERARGHSARLQAVIEVAPLISGVLVAAIGLAMVGGGLQSLDAAGRSLWP